MMVDNVYVVQVMDDVEKDERGRTHLQRWVLSSLLRKVVTVMIEGVKGAVEVITKCHEALKDRVCIGFTCSSSCFSFRCACSVLQSMLHPPPTSHEKVWNVQHSHPRNREKQGYPSYGACGVVTAGDGRFVRCSATCP